MLAILAEVKKDAYTAEKRDIRVAWRIQQRSYLLYVSIVEEDIFLTLNECPHITEHRMAQAYAATNSISFIEAKQTIANKERSRTRSIRGLENWY